jgi:hypothetical protein
MFDEIGHHEEIKEIIASCAGLYLESVAEQQSSIPDTDLNLTLEAINRSEINMILESVKILPEGKIFNQNLDLKKSSDRTL